MFFGFRLKLEIVLWIRQFAMFQRVNYENNFPKSQMTTIIANNTPLCSQSQSRIHRRGIANTQNTPTTIGIKITKIKKLDNNQLINHIESAPFIFIITLYHILEKKESHKNSCIFCLKRNKILKFQFIIDILK